MQDHIHILRPHSRAERRIAIERELHRIGATLQKTEAGTWRIAKGDAYVIATDLAVLSPRDLRTFERA